MSLRLRSGLLWGLVGALVFVLAHGAYLLQGGSFLGSATIAGVTVVVFATTAAGSYVAERRFGLFGRRFGGNR